MEISLQKVSEKMGGEHFGNEAKEKHEMIAGNVGQRKGFRITEAFISMG